jgi:hypothetical protein
MPLSDQQKAMFAKQVNRLSKTPRRFTAVVFTDSQNETAIRMGREQSPHGIADSVSFKGKKIVGTVSTDNRTEFLKQALKFKDFDPDTIINLSETMGIIKGHD